MISIYLGKTCVHFSELLLLKCDENAVLFFKVTHKGSLFSWKCPFGYVVIGGCSFFPNKYIEINQEPPTLKTKRKYITLSSTPQHLVCRGPGLTHYVGHNIDRFTLIQFLILPH